MQRVGGVSKYFFENISRIRNTEKVNVCSLFCSNEYFKNYFNRIWFSPRNQKLIYLKIVLEEIFLWINLHLSKYDIIHLTSDRTSVFRYVNRPVVTTIHDMIPELFHTSEKTIKRRKKTIDKCQGIICVSENTKNDLMKIYPEIPPSKITVINHGYENKQYDYCRPFQFRYILYVGTRKETYKNFIPFVRSIAQLILKSKIKLICTGAKFSTDEMSCFKSLGIENFMVDTGYITDEQLANIYHFAECFVYPSKYEGFGIPILEAFSHQTPACISNTSCFPEVGGDAVAYFNPNDEESIRDCVNRVLCDSSYRTQLISKSKERLKMFTWEQAAQKHINFYKRIINNYQNENSGTNHML